MAEKKVPEVSKDKVPTLYKADSTRHATPPTTINMAILPEVYWAQRSSASEPEKNIIYLTLILTDIKQPKVDLQADHLNFESGHEEDDQKYAVKLNFYDDVDVENSKQHLTGRGLFFVLRKKTPQDEFWPRLTKEKRLPYVKTDFDKWVDEDEQEGAEEPAMPEGGMDMSQLAGMGGAGGAGGPDIQQLLAQMGQSGAGGMGAEEAAAGLQEEELEQAKEEQEDQDDKK